MKHQLAVILQALFYIVLALLVCGLFFYLMGYSVQAIYWGILEGAYLRNNGLLHMLRWAMPLLITACGVILSFRCGFFNLGVQGQFYIGAIAATFTADVLNGAPAWLLIPSCLSAGMLGGALWAAWPGLLRLRYHTDEVITTLMGNFIAALVLNYVTTGPLKDPAGSGQQSSTIPLEAIYRLSDTGGVSPGICAITVIVVLLTWVLVNRTPFGILGGLAGRNPVMLNWQGGKVWQLGLVSFLISGALAGLAGCIEVLGPNGRLAGGFLPAQGFTSILIALVAGLSVTGAVVSSVFFGGLASAALYLPVMVGLPSAAIDVINACIALFITARSTWVRRFLGLASKLS